MVTTEFTLSLSSHARSYNRLASYILSEQFRRGRQDTVPASTGRPLRSHRLGTPPCLLASLPASSLPRFLVSLSTRWAASSLHRLLTSSPSCLLASSSLASLLYSLPRLLASLNSRLLASSLHRLFSSFLPRHLDFSCCSCLLPGGFSGLMSLAPRWLRPVPPDAH